MKRLFILLGMVLSITTVFCQNITRGEWFIDVDPGQGNGTPMPNFAPGDTVNIAFTIPTATLSSGFHYLATRVADVNGKWSRYESRGFYLSSTISINTTNIVAAESFVDSDPGPGNGTPASVGTAGAVVTFTAVTPPQLTAGFHFVAIRVKDAEGKWSLFEQRGFYVIPNGGNMPPIVAAEYFYDVDPGIGSGSSLTVSNPGDTITQTFMIPVPGSLSQGGHRLAIRVKDQSGNWSLFAQDSITVTNNASITCPGNVTVSAAAGQCSAVVNNIDPTVSPSGSAYTYTLSGATAGSGTGSASGHTFNAGVTTVTYALSNSPGTTCSFTVTVNSNIVPLVTIDANTTSICTGGTIVFTATPTNGGSTPHYQWKQNGINVGTDSVILQTNQLNNGDVVTAVMTSSIGCANPLTDTSNAITVTVTPPYITPTINITASQTSICPGTLVTFVATSTNGGVPWYSWYVNNVYVPGPNSDTFQSSTLANGDIVKCVLTSSLACVTSVSTLSNEITMTVNNQPATVTIAASQTTICPGQLVTFTATTTNSGTAPAYEWTLNGSVVGGDTTVYQSSSLQNGDVVRLTMQPYGSCGGNAAVYSNPITMTVNTGLTPYVHINASAIDICAGTPVTFTATPTNGGSNPHYQWKLNGNNVGGDSAYYHSSTLVQDDTIRVVMTSSLSCAATPTAVSNNIFMDVSPSVTPSVQISATDTTICYLQEVTFTATPTNGGSPVYAWTVNDNPITYVTGNVFVVDGLFNGDVVKVKMTSSLGCASPAQVVSNSITMQVEEPASPSVQILPDHNPICTGDTARFTAFSTNGGDHPSYQWTVNWNNVGSDTSVFTYSPAQSGDYVQVLMTSSLGCVWAATVESQTEQLYVDTIRAFYPDRDHDGYGNPDTVMHNCEVPEESEWVMVAGDCDDTNAAIHPDLTEVCGNGIDDNCNGQVDENCSSTLPTLIVRTYPAREGDAGLSVLNIEVTLDKPALLPVSVHYATGNEDAVAGLDYQSASGELLIPVGSASGNIQLRIIGDVLKESNERFRLNFSNPVNVLLPADPTRIMIIDDDKGRGNNHTMARVDQVPVEDESLKIPTIAKRNQPWMIPQIGSYPNKISLFNVQGQVVKEFVDYRNQLPLTLPTGLYFYRIFMVDGKNQAKYYSGRLLITE